MKVLTTICTLLCLVAMLGAAKAPPAARLTGATQGLLGHAGPRPPVPAAGAYPGMAKPSPKWPSTDDSLWINAGTVTGQASCNGLKVYGNQIWLSSGAAQQIKILDRVSGTVLRTISYPTTLYSMGLARYGTNNCSCAIACFYPSNVFYFCDTLGNWNSTPIYPPSGYQCRGLDYDGSKFWVADVNSPRLYTMNRAGTQLKVFTVSGGLQTPGWFMDICLDRLFPNRLWAIDNSPIDAYFISFDSSANTYSVRAVFTHPDAGNTPEGIGFWGDGTGNGYCYTSTYYAATIYKMQVHRVIKLHDVGVSAIINPQTMMAPNTTTTPSVSITNYGSSSEAGFPVTMWIDSVTTRVYNQTKTYTGTLAAGATANCTMAVNWTIGPMNNTYHVTAFTNLTADSARANDTLYENVVSMMPPNRCFDLEWTHPNDGHTIYGGCAVQDSLLFVAHGYYAPNRIMIYRISDLSLKDSFLTPQVSSYGYIDFYYDKNEDVLYAGAYGLTNAFDRWNPNTHAYIGRVSITGPQTPGSYCFAITGDQTTDPADSLYISGFGIGVYKCAKTGGNSHLIAAASVFPLASNIGLAKDNTHNVMYVTESYSPPDHLYEVSMATWTLILDTVLNPTLSDWGGCETFHGDTFLTAVVQDLDDIVQCRRLVPLTQDVGVDLVESPTGLITPGTYAPKVRFKNYGGNATSSFSALLTITGGYTDTKTVPAMNPGDTQQVTFADWTPTGQGVFTLRCSTELSGDQRARNDVGTGLALIPNFVQDFEASNGAFTTPTGGWAWGVPSSPRPAAHSGTNVWGGPLSGNYPDNMNWKLNSCQLFALQNNPVVVFYQWYYLESYYDGGNVKYSTDGGTTWQLLTPLASLGAVYNNTAYTGNAGIPGEPCFSGGPAGWQMVGVQIPVSTGAQFLVRWHEGSDPSVDYNGGWCIDDVAGIGCRPPVMDVGVTAIMRPNGSESPGSMVPVQIQAHNYGEVSATFDIRAMIGNEFGPDTLITAKTGNTLAPGGQQTFQMPDLWFPSHTPTIYAMRCSTVYAYDGNHVNDTMSKMIYTGTVDAAVTAMLAPTGPYDTLTVITPSAKVKNNGDFVLPIKAFFSFDSTGATTHSYSESLRIAGVSPHVETTLVFPDWAYPHAVQSYATRCSVYCAGDNTHGNDVMNGSFLISLGYQNIAVTEMLEPTGVKDTFVTITPSAKVRNLGGIPVSFPATFYFTDSTGATVYTQTLPVVNLSVGTETLLVFPDWAHPHAPGAYATTCSTFLAADTTPLNNVSHGSFVVSIGYQNVAVTAILAPNFGQDTLATITPSAKVKNLGAIALSFPTIFYFTDSTGATVYTQTLNIVGLSVGTETTLVFPDWAFPHPVGTYATKCTACLAADTTQGDNFKTGSFLIWAHPPEVGWYTKTSVPPGPKGKGLKDGGCITYFAPTDDSAFIYALKGNGRYEYYAYNTISNTWATKDSVTAIGRAGKKKAVKKGASMTAVGAAIFATKGNNSLEFWQYNPHGSGYAWTQMPDVPLGGKNVKEGSGMVTVHSNDTDYIYLLKGSSTQEFYRYNTETNVWEPKASAPTGLSGKPFKDGSCIAASEDGHSVFAVKANYSEMYSYSVDSDKWTTLTPVPLVGTSGKKKKVKSGAGMAYHRGIVYLTKGNNTLEFWSYVVDSNRWVQKEDFPSGSKKVKGGGALVYAPAAYGIFATRGNNTLDFCKYGLASDLLLASTSPVPNTEASSTTDLRGLTLNVSPNPFVNATKVAYSLPRAGNVSLKLYDVSGKLVSTLVNGYRNAGASSLILHPSSLSCGIYLLRLETENSTTSSKLIIQ